MASDSSDPRQIGELQVVEARGRRAQQAQPFVDQVSSDLESKAIARVMRSIDAGQFDPEAAALVWYEIHAIRRIQREITKAIEAGSVASERIPR